MQNRPTVETILSSLLMFTNQNATPKYRQIGTKVHYTYTLLGNIAVQRWIAAAVIRTHLRLQVQTSLRRITLACYSTIASEVNTSGTLRDHKAIGLVRD